MSLPQPTKQPNLTSETGKTEHTEVSLEVPLLKNSPSEIEIILIVGAENVS